MENRLGNTMKQIKNLFLLTLLGTFIISGCNPIPLPTVEEEILINYDENNVIFGMLLEGAIDDNGWSSTHYHGALYAEQKVPGTQLIFIDNVNPGDRPGVTTEELALDLYNQGAQIIIFNSGEMEEAAIAFASSHPEIQVIQISGDSAWEDGQNYNPLPNMTNAMGQMEYGKMLAGCSAALTTQTGKIGYLGAVEKEQTRRFVSAAFLGAQYCWTHFRNESLSDLTFAVEWMGYWFSMPGVTSDVSTISESFLEDGYDVIISGADTMEVSQVVQQHHNRGEEVWVIPYDYEEACEGYANICLGIPYFNWGPFYTRYLDSYVNGTPMTGFYVLEPDWENLKDEETSSIVFTNGPAMSDYTSTFLKVFEQELSVGINLWKGPLKFQDGSEFLGVNEIATETEIWYMSKLLYGIRDHASQ